MGLALVWWLIWALGVIDVPLFWDEIGVYGRGIFMMADQGWSLHPSALPPDISRGHPLLYTTLLAGWSQLAGTSLVSLRLVSWLISLMVLLVLYGLFRDGEGRSNALAPVLVLVQPLFLAQSTLVLPEMMLALFALLALWGYHKERWWVFLLAASAMILVKETALILLGGIMSFDFFLTIFRKKPFSLLRWSLLGLPILPYAIFLLVQKQTHGWYFFPYHMEGFQLTWAFWQKNMLAFLDFLFLQQGRWLWLGLMGWVLGVWAMKPAAFRKAWGQMEALALWMSFLYLAFYSTTYYMNRYTLVVLVLLGWLLAKGIWTAWQTWQPKWGWVLAFGTIALAGLVQGAYHRPRAFSHDENLSYLTYVKATSSAVNYLLEKELYKEPFYVNFPLDYTLLDSRYGYVPDSLAPLLNYAIRPETKHILEMSPPGMINNPGKLPVRQLHNWYVGYVEVRYLTVDSTQTGQ